MKPTEKSDVIKKALVVAALLLLTGCASLKEYYGENWWVGWNCADRYGTDVCGAVGAYDRNAR